MKISDDKVYLWKKRTDLIWQNPEGEPDDPDRPKVNYRKLLHGRVSVPNEENMIKPEVIRVTKANFAEVSQYINSSNVSNPMKQVTMLADPELLLQKATAEFLSPTLFDRGKFCCHKNCRQHQCKF